MDNWSQWVCLGCGYIIEGEIPPKKCTVCGAPRHAFFSRYNAPKAFPLKSAKEITVKPAPKEEMNHWVCLGCGQLYEGDSPPDQCAWCGAPRRAFMPRQYYHQGL